MYIDVEGMPDFFTLTHLSNSLNVPLDYLMHKTTLTPLHLHLLCGFYIPYITQSIFTERMDGIDASSSVVSVEEERGEEGRKMEKM